MLDIFCGFFRQSFWHAIETKQTSLATQKKRRQMALKSCIIPTNHIWNSIAITPNHKFKRTITVQRTHKGVIVYPNQPIHHQTQNSGHHSHSPWLCYLRVSMGLGWVYFWYFSTWPNLLKWRDLKHNITYGISKN